MSATARFPSLALLPAVAFAGCLPQTDLTRDRGAAEAGTAAAGGGVLVQPLPGATGVPRNLAALVARFSGPLAPGAELLLRGTDGVAVPTGAPSAAGCSGEGACLRVPVGEALAAGTAYSVEHIEGGKATALGAFTTGTDLDQDPPRLGDVALLATGGCLVARFATDEPVEASVVLRANGTETVVPIGAGLADFDVPVSLVGLPPDSDGEALVRVSDRAGNLAESAAQPLHVPPAGLPIVITEVLANAAGPEPQQEFVEIKNVGAGPVSLAGLRIEDATGADALPAVEIAAGAFALIVPSGFDAQSGKDVPPRVGTLLLRVDSRIGGDGLSNGGEPVRLRDAGGLEVSSYGGWVDVSSSAWAGKSVQRVSDAACDHPSSWNRKPLAATPGW
jgi:hypothetical protein